MNTVSAACLSFILSATTAHGMENNSGGEPLKIECAWNGVEVCSALIREFNERREGRGVELNPRESSDVAHALLAGERSVGLVQDSLAPAAAETLGHEFEALPLGRFVVQAIVNANSPVRKVTADELEKIFQGRITSWREVGNSQSAHRIELYSPLPALPETYIFRKTAMSGRPLADVLYDRSAELPRSKRTAEEVVGAVIQQRNSIGFLLCGYESKLDSRVRLLGIAKDERSAPVYPSVAAIADGSYPITDALTFYLHPDAPPIAREFCEFATGPEAAEIVKRFRIFPEYEWQQHMGKIRLAEMKAGKGEPIPASGSVAAIPMMRDLAIEFTHAKSVVQLQYQGGTQVESVGTFLRGGELLVKDAPLQELTITRYDAQWAAAEPKEVPLGKRAAAVIVHPTNQLRAVSIEQLRELYCGRIETWKPLGGDERPIHVFALPGTGPIAKLLDEKLRSGCELAKIIRRTTTRKLIESVAGDPLGIGFVDLSEVPDA